MERWVQTVAGPSAEFVRQPDLTIWFDLPAEIAAQRIEGARSPDKFESQPVEFFRRVSDGYRRRMAQDALRFARINADNSRSGVWQDVLQAVQARGWLA